MARCKDCIHDKVCNRDVGHGYSICPHYIKNADVAPKSELSPCDVCLFNPPSSMGGKPCTVCPAQKKGGAE